MVTGDSSEARRGAAGTRLAVAYRIEGRFGNFSPALASPRRVHGRQSHAPSPRRVHGRHSLAPSPRRVHGRQSLAPSPRRVHGRQSLAPSPRHDHGSVSNRERSITWHVAVVHETKRRTADLLAEGLIEWAGGSSSLHNTRVSFAPYTLWGIWDDASSELRTAIGKDPCNRWLLLQKVALLEQVELSIVAKYSRQASR